MMALTALRVRKAKPGRHADGNGLYLVVKESGSRSWILRMQVDGKRRDLGIGPISKVSLAAARTKAADLRARAFNGEDVRPKRVPKTVVPTFEEVARACHKAIKGGWVNKRHSDSWLRSLELHIFRRIGKLPIDAVGSADVRNALAPIWLKIPETADRTLQRIGVVLDYAHIQGLRKEESSLRSVRRGLPRQPVLENHYVSMPWDEVPGFVAKLRALPPTPGRDALIFAILTCARSGETRFSSWDEIDLQKGIWSLPAKRMKMKQPHSVPLSKPVVEILCRRLLARDPRDALIFSNGGSKPLSDMTMTKVLRDLGYAKTTVHGFRSSFTDWAAEVTEVPKEVVDKALAHKLVDRVEAAYRRTDFFERRRSLMEAWATFAWQ